MSAAIRFRNRRGARGSNTGATMAGTRYDVHRATDDRYVGQVEKREDGLWIMRVFDGYASVTIDDYRGRPEIGSNREACGEGVLHAYERWASTATTPTPTPADVRSDDPVGDILARQGGVAGLTRQADHVFSIRRNDTTGNFEDIRIGVETHGHAPCLEIHLPDGRFILITHGCASDGYEIGMYDSERDFHHDEGDACIVLVDADNEVTR